MRIRQSVVWTLLCSSLSLWAASQTWGFDEGDPAVGLNGLKPAYAPDDLDAETFEELQQSIDETWKAWTAETAQFVKDFYEGDHSTIESQRNSLKRLQVKVHTLEKALADPRYRSIHSQLADLYGKLAPRVDLYEAILDTLTVDPAQARAERLRPAVQSLHNVASRVQTDLRSFQGGSRWNPWLRLNDLKSLKADAPEALATVKAVKQKLERRETYGPDVRDFLSREPILELEDALAAVQSAGQKRNVDAAALRPLILDLLETLDDYRDEPSIELEGKLRQQLDAIRAQAADGGTALAQTVGANYLNYNLRMIVTEGLLNRFFGEHRQDTSRINERLMDAYVSGYQCSDVTVRLDLRPSDRNAEMDLTLTGLVRSNTNGSTHQATVQMVGNHRFQGRKPIIFDGEQFMPRPATVNVQANNQPVSARTKFSWIPLLGRVANNVAMREAASREPQANALTIRRISSQVREQLDEEADQRFANATKELQTTTYGPLRKYDLYPDVMALSSTDQEMRLWSRLMGQDEIGGSRPLPVASVPSNGLVAQIHESLLTHAFDRLGLNGKTMNEDEVRELLESRLSEILNRDVDIPEPEQTQSDEEQQANVLMFAENDPVRFTIDEGVVTLHIRAGLKRDNGDDIPTQVISVPFTPTIQNDGILLTRGNVGVRPVDRPPSVREQIARAQIMRQEIQSALPERTIDKAFVVEQEGKTVELAITGLNAQAGWLTVTLQ